MRVIWQLLKIRVCTPKDEADLRTALSKGWEPYAVLALDVFCVTYFLKRSQS